MAGTASLLLPVSNLTNLLALHQFRHLDANYLRFSWRPAIVAIVITVAVLAVLFHRDLRRSYVVPAAPEVDDKVLFWGSTAVCLLIGPAFVSGIEVAYPASAGALVLVVLFAVRRRSALRRSLIPAKLVIGVAALFAVVAFLSAHGLETLLTRIAGTTSELRLSVTAAFGANLVDNLPAYLAMEPVASSDPHRMTALLIGVNCGCLLTLWGSLATLLWRARCRAAGVHISWWSFLWRGLILTPLVITGTVFALG